jgi:pyrroloquinoline quinone (PQQ) biosynthesis protein C
MTRPLKLIEELNYMVNRQFETPEFVHFLSVPLTRERARFFTIEGAHYIKNRRDCWGYVQGAAPLDVKSIIWKHEEDELINDPRCNTDHYTLTVRTAEALGLTREEIERMGPFPLGRAALYAWIHLAKDRSWLEAFTASAILERRNNGKIVTGGSLSARIGKKWVEELGFRWEDMPDINVHKDADEAHSDLMEEIFNRHVKTSLDEEAVLRGARESLEIDRAYRGGLADAMEKID